MLKLVIKAIAETCCLFGTGTIVGGIASRELEKTDSKVLKKMGEVAAFFLTSAVTGVAMAQADSAVDAVFDFSEQLLARKEENKDGA